MGLRSSGSTAVSYASAVSCTEVIARPRSLELSPALSPWVDLDSQQMVPIERPALPYAIGSPDWSLVNGLVRYMDPSGNEDLTDWIESVMKVYKKVYAIAKFVVVVFYFYNVDVREGHSDVSIPLGMNMANTCSFGGSWTIMKAC